MKNGPGKIEEEYKENAKLLTAFETQKNIAGASLSEDARKRMDAAIEKATAAAKAKEDQTQKPCLKMCNLF